jgi:hypothetical protein
MEMLATSDHSTLALSLGPPSNLHSKDVHVMTHDAPSMKYGASRVLERSSTVTVMKPSSLKVKKRIIVCCDGYVVYPRHKTDQRWTEQPPERGKMAW